MKTNTITPGFARFASRGGYRYEREAAKNVFVLGQEYRVTGGQILSSYTFLTFEGIEEEWNSALFEYDLATLPVSNPYKAE